ncbi:MAG: hypothetical protein K0R68_2096 [Mycobacterium sp.]|nr:hypothetical protein [Mycobacterium sp.]
MDLAGARFAAAGYVGDLDLADRIAAATHEFDEVPFTDLRVVQVEHHLHVGVSDPLDQGERVLRAGQRHTRMVDDGVQVLQAERHAGLGAQLAQRRQTALGGEPHLTGDPLTWPGGMSVDQFTRVDHQASDPENGSSFDRCLRGAHHLVGAPVIVEVSVQVARHGREPRAGGGQCVQVLVLEAPDLDAEAQLVDTAHPFQKGEVGENHLGADGQLERTHARTAAARLTGAPVWMDSAAAKAISSATRASCPVTVGATPERTLATKWASCAT